MSIRRREIGRENGGNRERERETEEEDNAEEKQKKGKSKTVKDTMSPPLVFALACLSFFPSYLLSC